MFISYQFIVFLVSVLILYYLVPKRLQWIFLLIANFVFYMYADIRYPIFLVITTAVVYTAARIIETYENVKINKSIKKKKKFIMMTALFIVLGILICVKYTNFIIRNFNICLIRTGHESIPFVDFVIPMGISFYTFQAIAYLLDVYWGRCKAQKNFLKFLLFMSFFPQLIQGPINRYNDMSESLYERHDFRWDRIRFGLERILWGYFKKLVIADRAGIAVSALAESQESYTGIYVIAGMIFYAVQLYADFTGGIDITIGIAESMGISMKENFIRPFFSKNIAEYWRRWHISMGTWFKDYVFYPCGISRPVKKITIFCKRHFGMVVARRAAVYISSIIVWIATGIWHGAEWRFVVWGLLNGIIILISEELTPLYHMFHKKFSGLSDTVFYRGFQIIRTCFLMSCLRLFDVYGSVKNTFRQFFSIFTGFTYKKFGLQGLEGLGLLPADYIILFCGVIIMFLVSTINRNGNIREKLLNKPYVVRYIIFTGMLFAIVLFGTYGRGYDAAQFIYNRF